jgi:exopolysaccharide biosynthesis polyprenyl glycosylphosphotransferase
VSGWYLLFFQVADVLLTVLSLWLAVKLRRWLPFGPVLDDQGWVSPLVYLVAMVQAGLVYASAGVYRADRLSSMGNEIRTMLRASVVGIILLAGLLYFLDRGVSRWLFIYYGLIKLSLVVSTRLAAHGVCRALGVPLWQPRQTLIIGAGALGQDLAQRLRQADRTLCQVVGYLDDRKNGKTAPDGLPILGRLAEAELLVRTLPVDQLLVALPHYEADALGHLMATLHDVPVEVKVIPDYLDLAYLYARSDELAGIPAICLKEPILTARQRAFKRIFDLIGASLLLIVASPVLLISALAIKLDSAGPVGYRQKRVGEGGRLFHLYKLRTMVVNADQHEHLLVKDLGDSLKFNKQPDDPRVTRVGAFLRRWSIDELPQLLNVIKGQMSLVGPRPELPALMERYSVWQRKRFSVPQGVTGWWQVNGRPQNVSDKVEHDLDYVRNYSLWLDVWILIKTVWAVAEGNGAF